MKTKIQIKTFFGKVLFEYENENNTITKTVEEAAKSGATLEGAYLRGANLRGANLRGANLEGTDLRGADLIDANLEVAYLRGANLRGANLRGAYLEGTDLRGADLRGANLRGANLRGSDLRGADLIDAYLSGAENTGEAYIPIHCKWSHSMIGGKIQIGCESKTSDEWEAWLESKEEFETNRGTPEFKQIEAVIRAYISYSNVLTE